MASVSPADETVAIFNTLVRTAPAETEAIARVEWRLRSLVRSRPNDSVVEVALLYALLMLGKADEALPMAERLWHMRNIIAVEQLGTLLFELAHLGMYEKAVVLLDDMRQANAEAFVTNFDVVAVNIAWGLGDIKRAAAAMTVGRPSVWGSWLAFVDEIKRSGLAPHLNGRQKIVREKTFGRQCLSQLILTPGAEYPQELTHYVYISGNYEDRLNLEDEIHSALDNYFKPLNLAHVHWSSIAELIAPITAAPPWHRDFFVDAA
jgi:hypothetical protein